MSALSICLIVKNEEKNIAKCLRSLSPLQSEVVVVDTGSEDRTLEIARSFTDQVFSFPWNDDFSAARNYAAAHASNNLILAVDCDEFLIEANIPDLFSAAAAHPEGIGMIERISPFPQNEQQQTMRERIGRLYDRRLFRYSGTIHESVTSVNAERDPSGYGEDTLPYFEIPLTFFHGGYEEPDLRLRKAERDLRMLQADLAKNGPNPYNCFQIGKCYVVMNNHAMAANYFDQGLSMDVNPSLVYVQEMVESYGYCLLELRQYQKALQLANVYDEFAKRADFCFLMGLIYMNNALFPEAIGEFEKATTMKTYSIEGVNSYSAWYNIGVIHEVLGNTKEAVSYYRKCGAYAPALDRLQALSETTP